MQRFSLSFTTVPDSRLEAGKFCLYVNMTTWDDNKPIKSEEIMTKYVEIQPFDQTSDLNWCEYVLDEMYKAVNAERAARLESGWVSGTCASS